MKTMKIPIMFCLLLVASPLGAGETIRWTTITAGSETEPLGINMQTIRSVSIPPGQTWALNSGALQYPPAVVCHLWMNDSVTQLPLHIPYVQWGVTSQYLVLPTGLTVRGPTTFIFWCWNTGFPTQIFYSLEWTVTP